MDLQNKDNNNERKSLNFGLQTITDEEILED